MSDPKILTDASGKPAHPTDVRVAEVRVIVGSMVKTVQRALPKGSPTDAERFCQICMTAFLAQLAEVRPPQGRYEVTSEDQQEKALIFASDNSLKRVIAQAAELDLQPGSSLGYCWFIRYGASATFQIGVWGYVQLLLRHPDVAKVHSDVIFEADKYRVTRGSSPELIHEPAWELEPRVDRKDGGRGKRLGAYAVATFKDGTSDFVVVPEWDLERAKSMSKAQSSPAYTMWPDEMAQRTAIKRAQKRWPKSAEFQRALEVDESDSVREDLADMIQTVETAGAAVGAQPVSKQKSVLDELTRSLPMRNGSGIEQTGSSMRAPEAAAAAGK